MSTNAVGTGGADRYLSGNFAPVREEQTVLDLAVAGTLPDFLDGRYLRNGPNPVTDPPPGTYHWFLGSGMVHGLRLGDGRAHWYRNRWVRSGEVAAALGEEPRPGPIHAGFDFAANTNLIGQGGRTFAIVEAGARPYELTDELATVGPCDFDGTLPGGYTAHPHRDPATGEMHAVAYFFGWGNRVQYIVQGADGRVRRTVDLDVGGAPMMHDFSLTESYVVLYDLPAVFDIGVAAMMRTADAPTLPYRWDPEHPARIGVFRRDGDGSDLRWFPIEPCYVYHPMNAFEEGTTLVLDVVRHPSTFRTDLAGPNEGPPTLDRWTVDLAGGTVSTERLDDRGQEFPRTDERRFGLPYRYGYSVGFDSRLDDGMDLTDAVVKHDLVDRSEQVRTFGPGRAVSEFVFVPAHDGAAEDEGVLMGLVHDLAAGETDLAVIDAQTLDDVATVHIPARVPFGFHGNWVPTP